MPAAADQKTQEAFDAYLDRIYAQWISENPFQIHFYLEHPENYGIELSSYTLMDYSCCLLYTSHGITFQGIETVDLLEEAHTKSMKTTGHSHDHDEDEDHNEEEEHDHDEEDEHHHDE